MAQDINNWTMMINCTVRAFTQEQIDLRLMVNMPISVFGAISNIINIYVFSKCEMRRSLVNWFLLSLSISDLFLLVCNFFFLLFPVIADMSNSQLLHDCYPFSIRVSYPLALTAQTCGVYLTVLVSMHRYLGVCHPFRARRWVTHGPVRRTLIGAVTFSILLNTSRWFELQTIPCVLSTTVTTYMIALTSLQKVSTYFVGYRVLTYTIVMFIIPFVTLIVVNTQMIVALKQSSNLRFKSSHRQSPPITTPIVSAAPSHDRLINNSRLSKAAKYSDIFRLFNQLTSGRPLQSTPSSAMKSGGYSRDRSVTLMLIAIVAMFLVDIVFEYDPELGYRNMQMFEKFVEFGNILVSLNSSTTIFIYLIFSTKYRHIVKQCIGLAAKYNGVALATGIAAQRALELNVMLSDEIGRKQSANGIVGVIANDNRTIQLITTTTNNGASSRDQSPLLYHRNSR